MPWIVLMIQRCLVQGAESSAMGRSSRALQHTSGAPPLTPFFAPVSLRPMSTVMQDSHPALAEVREMYLGLLVTGLTMRLRDSGCRRTADGCRGDDGPAPSSDRTCRVRPVTMRGGSARAEGLRASAKPAHAPRLFNGEKLP